MADDRDEPMASDHARRTADDARPEESHPPEDEVSWLGCLWLVIVPLIVLGAVVVALNYLGC